MADSGADAQTICTSDSQCDDGLFCNGEELCLPADAAADVRGCVPADADACIEGQTCDEDADLCQTMCDVSGDADGDGHDSVDCGGDDCDDADATNYPGNAELCDPDGHDEDCDPTTLGTDGDADGDGHLRLECCNPQADGTDLCGDDCDDTQMTVNPEALEVCDGDVDNDCNGLADADDGVCVPCDAGYRGFDGSCENIDECAEGAPCGGATGAGCIDTPGNYICTCPSGYTAPPIGGTCVDDDECATASPCGSAAGSTCTNTPGSFTCSCASGYQSPTPGAPCVDVDECAMGTPCGSAARTICLNSAGSYSCVCPSGYSAPVAGGTCADVDECAMGTPCGVVSGTTCSNTVGAYICRCPSGYVAPAVGGSCVDVDECALDTPCGGVPGTSCGNIAGSYVCRCPSGYSAPAAGGRCANIDECTVSPPCGRPAAMVFCTDTPGSYICGCSPGYTAPGNGGTCQLTNSSLWDLVPSAGTLQDPNGVSGFTGFTEYTLELPAGTSSFTLTPTVTDPGGVTSLTVNGVEVASGTASLPISINGWQTVTATIRVETESGATTTYLVTVSRHVTYVKSSATAINDYLGRALALSSDGTTVAIGVLATTWSPQSAVYIFQRSGSVWIQQARLIASNDNRYDYFGESVTLSADGSTLAVGASRERSCADGISGNQLNNSCTNAGAVYVFKRTSGSWSQVEYIKASNSDADDGFGTSVSLSDDGASLAVGAHMEASSATGVDGDQTDNTALGYGAVYVFKNSGGVWAQDAYIKASNSDSGDEFGYALDLSGDGLTLAVGARYEDSSSVGIGGSEASNSASSAGAVYVFVRGTSTWSQQAYVKASNADAGDIFGSDLALSTDGSTLAVAAPNERSNAIGINGNELNNGISGSSGAVYIFSRVVSSWSQQAYVKSSNNNSGSGIGGGDRFGEVGVSGDGSTLIVGAPREDSNATDLNGDQTNDASVDSGAAYVFAWNGSRWSQMAYVKATNTDANDRFGVSVAIADDGATLAIGSLNEQSNAIIVDGYQSNNSVNGAGAVYVY
ncbi:MAG: hypothetical protein GXP55_22345 [Deltaproteobacteria bacterium]|nr:hypothetical protein [Deltaproteobacteria bacterium]